MTRKGKNSAGLEFVLNTAVAAVRVSTYQLTTRGFSKVYYLEQDPGTSSPSQIATHKTKGCAAMQTGQIPLLSQHGILQERFCSMTTDAIRAAILEQVGYQTQVLEFIDMEHTAKNLLLRAVRRPSSEKPTQTTKATKEMKRFCDVFQVPPLHLERTLQEAGFPLSPQYAESE